MPENSARRRSRLRYLEAGVVATAWLVVLAVSILCLEHAGEHFGNIAAYLGAWVVGCTFPGVMVWRALAGHTTIVRELGFGSVLGIVLELIAWAVATAVHVRSLMWLLPALVVILFAAVPDLRRHWFPRRTVESRTPLGWHVAMAVVISLALFRFYELSMIRALPPAPSVIARDTWYNSALSYELSRTLRPRDPFAEGIPLRYHWFADAHITATAELSRTPIVNAMINLWLVPILIVLLLAVAAAAQQFMDGPRLVRRDGTVLSDARRWWAGPVAAFFVLVAPALWRFGSPGTQRVGDGFVVTSPSGILAMVLVVALVGPVLDFLRGRARAGTWVVLALMLACCVGTKPSILPVVAFGAAVVLVFELVSDRHLNRPMAFIVCVSALLAVAAAPILTGSTGGSHFQLLGLMSVDPSYVQLMGGSPVVGAAGGWLVPALAQRVPHAIPIIGMLFLAWVLTETPRLLCLTGLVLRPLRTDPGVQWACGVIVGGYGGMWVLAHPGYSEHYFWTVTLALSTTVTVTNAVRLLPASRRARTLVLPVMAVAVPAAAAAYYTTTGQRVNVHASTWSVIGGRLRPYGVMFAVLALVVLAIVLIRRFVRRSSVLPVVGVIAFCLAACLPVPVIEVSKALPSHVDPPLQVGRDYRYVAPEQERAAIWLRTHSASTAVVATNMFCWPMGKDTPHCIHNSMWLSGLSGRRMVLGDWSYTAPNLSNSNGILQLNQLPSPWPERQRLSTEAVQNPTPAVLRTLRQDYGAGWIFADDRATTISPRLAALASLRYESTHIRIYRLLGG